MAELGSRVLGTGSRYPTYALGFVQPKLTNLLCFMKQNSQTAFRRHWALTAPTVRRETPRRPAGLGTCSGQKRLLGSGRPSSAPSVSPSSLAVPSHLSTHGLP